MRIKTQISFLLLSLIFLSGFTLGQEISKDYIFKYINESQGLTNNHIPSIFKDRLGFLWFATGNGLNRFDGTRMRTFFTVDSDTNSISTNYLSKIFEGPGGNLWIKNVNGGFDVYDLELGKFSKNINFFSQKYGLKSDRIQMVAKDRQGRYWFAHPNEGISVFNPLSNKSEFLVQNSYAPGNLNFNQVSYISFSPFGEAWVIYQNGFIDVVDTGSLRVIQTFNLDNFLKGEKDTNWEVFVDFEGEAWVFLPNLNTGIFRINPEDGAITQVNQKSKPFTLNNNLVKSIIENKKGEIWIGTDHGGINILDKAKETVVYLTNNPEETGSISENTIYSLLKDSDGIIWVGTSKMGANFYHEGMMRFAHIKKSNSGEKSLPYNDINVFAEDAKGNLYIGTNGDGLWYYDRKKGTYQHYLHDPNNKNSLSGNVIVDMKIDQDGVLWLGTYLHGLSSFDGNDFKNYQYDALDPNSLSDINVWKIYVDKANRVWLGTLRAGLNLFNRDSGTFTRFPVGDPKIPLNNQYISALSEDDEGNIWVGGGYGIDVFNLENGYHRYFSGLDPNSGLLGNNVTELMRDSDGLIWATTGQGLNYFDKDSGKFVGYSKKDGLVSDFLVSVLEDENKNLWLSTQNGLSYVTIDRTSKPFRMNFRSFDMSDGLQASLFNKNSSLRTSKGEMIFGGPNGYNIFKTSNFAFALDDPKVVFTGLQLFNKPVKTGEQIDGKVILSKSISTQNKIVLKHFQNIFSVDFSALNFINFEKNKFRYRLLGFNDEWTILEEPPFRVTYTNLDPGNYKLVVQAAKNDGVWSQEENVMEIKIEAPFWKTPLAYLIYLLVLVVLGYLARNFIQLKERENFKRLEEKREAQRIYELFQLKNRFFTNVSHEFKTPLTLILAPVEKLLSTDGDPVHTKQYQTIQRNAKRLLQLVNQILDIKHIEKEGISLNPSDGDVIRFIENKVRDFGELSEKNHISLRFTSSIKRLPTRFDADKLEKIIFNLLSNAFKFTPNDGEILVSLDLKEVLDAKGVLEIKVKDSGIGISEGDISKVFDRYFTAQHSNEISNQGSGIGLSLVREFARIHGGDIRVESELGMGSEFVVTISIPVKEDLLNLGIEFNEKSDEAIQDILETQGVEKPSLLLVEDNLEFRQYLKEYLEEDYQIILAQDGKDGLDKALTHIPDLIISDVMMPLMDGVELCQHIKKDLKTSHIPVILLTARSSEDKHLEGLKSGCNQYLSKPFKLEILMSSIRNLLQEQERLQKHFRKRISINTSEQEIESLDDKLIQNAMKTVEANIEDPEFSVEQMSRELGMSRVHLYKKLSALTGKSPVEFIRLVRLQRATQLLKKSQLTVAEVAYQVGFNNAKYFTKQFKAEFGVLPSQYAEKTKTSPV
jgi:signal transduction histidine kinase/ligand-binding sensor domain-containing protein/DNA-binding response OmpR family regulator